MPVGDKSNNFDDIDKIEKAEVAGSDFKAGFTNDAYQCEKPPLPSTSNGESSYPSDKPPPYEETQVVPAKGSNDGKGIEATDADDEEEKILNVLREIVRKCTLANPMKRPTAKEVLRMIEEVAPPDLLSEKFNISDDEEEEDSIEKKIK